MASHQLTATQFVPRPIDEVFEFFAEPRNLARLTPRGMDFRFLSDDFEMRQGLEIDYRLRPLFGIPVTWRTLIERYEPPVGFRDVQLAGPYARWVHEHTFRAVEGGTLVEDDIEYRLPLGPLGDLGHPLVSGELRAIFGYRARTIAALFAVPSEHPQPLTVAVAGGTGFVGGGIAQELYRRGHRVIVLSHRGEEARGPLPDSIEIRQVDATADPDAMAPALADVDSLVIALAFRNSPIEDPRHGQTFMAVDAAGTENLVAAARSAGVRRLVYLSGAGAEPDAKKRWFRAKWRAEEAVRGSGITHTIIRPTWIYGPRDVSLNRFIGFARRLFMVPLTNLGGQHLAPVFIDDVAGVAADALTSTSAADRVFELGGPDEFTMRRIIHEALTAAGLWRPIIPAPSVLVKLAAVPLSFLPRPILTPSAVDFINQPATVDTEPLLAAMPRRLTPLDEGLRSYLLPGSGPGELAIDGRPERDDAIPQHGHAGTGVAKS
jgi:uncharacterized protein YbjT (DUF2867 family)/ligand-binding SRPBCC domain-containing protein